MAGLRQVRQDAQDGGSVVAVGRLARVELLEDAKALDCWSAVLVLEARLERFIEAVSDGGVAAGKTGGRVGQRPGRDQRRHSLAAGFHK